MLAGERSKRNSIFSSSKNSAISVLRQKIKAANKDINALDDYDPYLPAEISKAQILINRKPVTVRKVYLTNSNYKIGWVVDYDLSYCMVCLKHFNWMTKLKHHCRACGSLVCSYCSPYKSIIPSLDQQEEEGGSRVCNNCFGLKTDVFESVQPKAKIDRINSTANGSNSSIHSNNSSNSSTNNPPGIGITTPYPTASNNRSSRRININTTSDNDTLSSTSNSPMSMLSSASSTRPQLGSVRRRSTNNRDKTKQKQSFNSELFEENLIEAMEIFEKEQLPKYEESYRKMREIIPLDIYKSTKEKLVDCGLPESVAGRVWDCKILWLIAMHPEDISKIHLADFRGKFSIPTNLDILEMRAIWYNLPTWSLEGLQNGDSTQNVIIKGKIEWKSGFKARLDDMAYKESRGTLPERLIRSPAYQGYDHIHLFDSSLSTVKRFDRSASFLTYEVPSPFSPEGEVTPGAAMKRAQSAVMTRGFNTPAELMNARATSLQMPGANRTAYMDAISSRKNINPDLTADDNLADEADDNLDENDDLVDGVDNAAVVVDDYNIDDLLDNDYPISELTSRSNSLQLAARNSKRLVSESEDVIPPGLIFSKTQNAVDAEDEPEPESENVEEIDGFDVDDMPEIMEMTFKQKDRNTVTFKNDSDDEHKDRSSSLDKMKSIPSKVPFQRQAAIQLDKDEKAVHESALNSSTKGSSVSIRKSTEQSEQNLNLNRSLFDQTPVDNKESNRKVSYTKYPDIKYDTNLPERPIQESSSPITTASSTPKKEIKSPSRKLIPVASKEEKLNGNTCTQSGNGATPAYKMSEEDDATEEFVYVDSDKYANDSPDESTDSFHDLVSVGSNNSRHDHNGKVRSARFTRKTVDSSDASTPYSRDADQSWMLSTGKAMGTAVDDSPNNLIMMEGIVQNTPLVATATKEGPKSTIVPTQPKSAAKPSDVINKKSVDTFIASVLNGDATFAMHILSGNNGISETRLKAWLKVLEERSTAPNQLLLKCCNNMATLKQPVEILVLILDTLGADVFAIDDAGNTPLHFAVGESDPLIFEALLERGADVLERNSAGDCPLGLSLSNNDEKLLNIFISKNGLNKLIESNDVIGLKMFAHTLILAGYPTIVSGLLKKGVIKITVKEATKLLSQCSGNFDTMHEPVETFELLESLGAVL